MAKFRCRCKKRSSPDRTFALVSNRRERTESHVCASEHIGQKAHSLLQLGHREKGYNCNQPSADRSNATETRYSRPRSGSCRERYVVGNQSTAHGDAKLCRPREENKLHERGPGREKGERKGQRRVGHRWPCFLIRSSISASRLCWIVSRTCQGCCPRLLGTASSFHAIVCQRVQTAAFIEEA